MLAAVAGKVHPLDSEEGSHGLNTSDMIHSDSSSKSVRGRSGVCFFSDPPGIGLIKGCRLVPAPIVPSHRVEEINNHLLGGDGGWKVIAASEDVESLCCC